MEPGEPKKRAIEKVRAFVKSTEGEAPAYAKAKKSSSSSRKRPSSSGDGKKRKSSKLRGGMSQRLLAAAKTGHLSDVICALAEKNADVNEVEIESGRSALHFACTCGHAAVASKLVEHPAINLNLQDFEGNTPLHLSAEAGQKRVVGILLEAGAQLAYTTNSGQTAEQIARANGHVSVEHFDCFDLIAEKALAQLQSKSVATELANDEAESSAIATADGAVDGDAASNVSAKRKMDASGMTAAVDPPLLQLLEQFGLEQYAECLGNKGLANSRMLATITETAAEVENFLHETCRAKTFAKLAFRKLIKRVHR
jgi:hypothetical protein